MDLGLELKPPPARGRRAMKLNIAKKRDLTEADVNALWDIPEGGLESQTNQVLKIRNTHHALARLLAEGRKQVEVSSITGYSPSYISSIQNDPAFKNLVAYYKGQVEETFVSVHERLAALSMLSAEELQARLTENPDDFTIRELNELLSLSADRTGFGPQSRVTNLNVNVDLAERLRKGRERAGLGEQTSPSLSDPEGHRPPQLTLRANDPETLMKEMGPVNLFEKE